MKPGDPVRLRRQIETFGRTFPAGTLCRLGDVDAVRSVGNLHDQAGRLVVSAAPFDSLELLEQTPDGFAAPAAGTTTASDGRSRTPAKRTRTPAKRKSPAKPKRSARPKKKPKPRPSSGRLFD